MNLNLKSLNHLQGIALLLIMLSTILLIYNLINIDYADFKITNAASPLSNVLLIISMGLLLFSQRNRFDPKN